MLPWEAGLRYGGYQKIDGFAEHSEENDGRQDRERDRDSDDDRAAPVSKEHKD